MTKEQAAAYVFAQSVAALAAIEGMKAANADRARRGEALAYPEAIFNEVADDFCINHDAVMKIFEEANAGPAPDLPKVPQTAGEIAREALRDVLAEGEPFTREGERLALSALRRIAELEP